MRFLGSGLLVAAVLALTACGGDDARTCEEALTTAATSVDGVVEAEFTCERSFGNPSQKGTVTIAGTTETAVVAVMEGVLRSFAAAADLGDASVVYTTFINEDGTISVQESLVGFNGTPSIGDLREHYDIEG